MRQSLFAVLGLLGAFALVMPGCGEDSEEETAAMACVEGETQCLDNAVQTCLADGTWESVECEEGMECMAPPDDMLGYHCMPMMEEGGEAAEEGGEAAEEGGEATEGGEAAEEGGEVAEEGGEATEGGEELLSIAATAEAAGNFNTLLAAVEAGGLTETLSGEGTFTVFAPTDDAFGALPEGTVAGVLAQPDVLNLILMYHILDTVVMSETLMTLTAATTMADLDLSIEVVDGAVVLNGTVNVTSVDILCTNGVIHVIDGVLMPPEPSGEEGGEEGTEGGEAAEEGGEATEEGGEAAEEGGEATEEGGEATEEGGEATEEGGEATEEGGEEATEGGEATTEAICVEADMTMIATGSLPAEMEECGTDCFDILSFSVDLNCVDDCLSGKGYTGECSTCLAEATVCNADCASDCAALLGGDKESEECLACVTAAGCLEKIAECTGGVAID